VKSKHAQMNAVIMVFAIKESVNAILVTLMPIVACNTSLKTVTDMDNVLITHVVYVLLASLVLVVKRKNAQ